MSIDKSELEKTIVMARLQIGSADVQKLITDVEKILSYAEQLKEVDVTGVSPTFYMVGHELPLREDNSLNGLPVDSILSAAPEKESSFFSVPGILADI